MAIPHGPLKFAEVHILHLGEARCPETRTLDADLIKSRSQKHCSRMAMYCTCGADAFFTARGVDQHIGRRAIGGSRRMGRRCLAIYPSLAALDPVLLMEALGAGQAFQQRAIRPRSGRSIIGLVRYQADTYLAITHLKTPPPAKSTFF